ncbi:MAG: hypothetical protein N3E39_00190 [Candidatus Methanomethylicia archaeon]|nr:hypothetical protein [Candidatus Methanomethylicia archaeon]
MIEESYDLERIKLEAQIKELKQIIEMLQDRLRFLEASLNIHKWHPFKSGTGEWAFSDDFPELKRRLIEANARDSNYLEIDGYRYRLSGENDRFIQRFPLK